MIIFKTYTSGRARNSQMTSENFFECVFSTLLESTPQKIFVISRKALMNIFEGCTYDYFQNIHPVKSSK